MLKVESGDRHFLGIWAVQMVMVWWENYNANLCK